MRRSRAGTRVFVLAAVLLTAGCGSAAGDAAVQSRDGGPVGDTGQRPAPAERPDADAAESTHQPDPCGVHNQRDLIARENGFFEGPADRVQAKAKKLFGDRFLGVFVADSARQYGVGIGVHRLTDRDQKAFFDATCFRIGDVVFQDAPVSRSQLENWVARVEKIAFTGSGSAGCLLMTNRLAGLIEVGLQAGHPEVREEIEAAVPGEHVTVKEDHCPVPL